MNATRNALGVIAIVLCGSCANTADRAPAQTEATAPTESEPVLRFDIVDIPRPGKVERVSGDVQRFIRKESAWVTVKNGYRLSHEDQFRIGPGAALVVVFSASERAEFSAAPADRWIQFHVVGQR